MLNKVEEEGGRTRQKKKKWRDDMRAEREPSRLVGLPSLPSSKVICQASAEGVRGRERERESVT